MIAAKRAWSLYKKKKAAFITWPSKLCKLEKPLSLSLSLSVNPNPKIPCSHGEDLFTCIILNIKDYIYIYIYIYIYRQYNKTSGGFARSCVLGNCLPLFYCSNSLDICQYSSLTNCILLNTFLVSHHLDSLHLFKPS